MQGDQVLPSSSLTAKFTSSSSEFSSTLLCAQVQYILSLYFTMARPCRKIYPSFSGSKGLMVICSDLTVFSSATEGRCSFSFQTMYIRLSPLLFTML